MLRQIAAGVLLVAAMPLLHALQQPGDNASAPCVGATAAPTGVAAKVENGAVTLTWQPPPGSPGEYNIELGNAPGSTYLGTVDTGGPGTSFTKPLDPGIYYVRVRAKGRCGVSAASAEIRVAVDEARIGPRTKPDVIVAKRTAARNTYFPTAERLKNGHLVVVYYDSPDHVSPAGRISMVRSLDAGKTWSAPWVVVAGPRDTRDPSIIQTTRGTLIVSYFESDASQSPTSQGAFVIRSADEGRTWSAPIRIDTMLRGAATSAKIVEMANGDLIAPLYGLRPGSEEAVATLARSSDQGVTWPRAAEVTIAAAPGIDFVEPAVADLGRGRLLAMFRTERGERFAHENHSLDDGRTWSAPAKTAFAAQSSDLLAIPQADARPLVVHTWGDTTGRFGDSRPTVIQVTRFLDFPTERASDPPRVLHQGHCWSDEGQPSSVLLPGARLFTVYYDACAGYIGGTFSSLPDPATLEECRMPPGPPTALRVVTNSGGTVTVAWTAPSGPRASYIVEAGRTPGSADVTNADTGPRTTFSASGVMAGTYYVRIRATNMCGTGDPSKEVAVVVR